MFAAPVGVVNERVRVVNTRRCYTETEGISLRILKTTMGTQEHPEHGL